jgi:hypothetical protein
MTVAAKWRRLASATWLTAGIGLVATSCSFLFDLDADQCSVDADCQKFEGELSVCDAGLCVASSSSAGNGGSSTAGTGSGDAGAAGHGGSGETGCKSNAECLDANFLPHICQAGECVGLLTDECPLVIGEDNLRAKAPIILGAYTLAPNGVDVSVASRNIDLVVSELTSKVTGLPGGPDNSKRTVAFVVCNSSFPEVAPGTIEPFEPSLAHLVDTLQVPGILSGLSARDLEAVFSQRLNEAGTFVVSPYEQDSELAMFSDGGRLWHLLGATSDLAPAFGPLLTRTEQYLRANAFLNLDEDDPKLRVAIVTAKIARETDVRDALIELPELAGFNVKHFALDSALVTATPDTASVAQGLLAYAPNIIVALAGSEFIEDIFPVLEAGTTWGKMGTATQGQSRPMYLLGAAMAPETWFRYSTKEGDGGGYGTLLDRIVGVAYASAEDTELLDSYTTRLISENEELQDPAVLLGSENVYDAAYLLIYAAAAAGEVPELNGTEMSRGMRHLLAGERYDVGPADILKVINTLQGGGDVGLRLTIGEPDWNTARGTRRGTGSVYCLNNGAGSPETDLPRGPNNDVLRYDPEENVLESKPLPCIPGF